MNDPALSVFERLVAEAAATLRQGQSDLLGHFWRLGELVDRLQREAPERTLRHFAAGLRDAGQDVSAAQLQQAKRIFDRYQAEELPTLVERGFTITHLKALLPLDEALRERVEQAAVGDDGRVRSTRELREAVRAERIRSLAEDPPAEDVAMGTDDAPAYTEAARLGRSPSPQVETIDGDGGPLAGPAEIAASAPAISAITVGAVATREYSRPPLAVLKRASCAAEALADVMPALWTAIAEAERIGWDSERAQHNFRDQAELLITAFDGLRQVAPTAVERLRAALRA